MWGGWQQGAGAAAASAGSAQLCACFQLSTPQGPVRWGARAARGGGHADWGSRRACGWRAPHLLPHSRRRATLAEQHAERVQCVFQGGSWAAARCSGRGPLGQRGMRERPCLGSSRATARGCVQLRYQPGCNAVTEKLLVDGGTTALALATHVTRVTEYQPAGARAWRRAATARRRASDQHQKCLFSHSGGRGGPRSRSAGGLMRVDPRMMCRRPKQCLSKGQKVAQGTSMGA